MAPITRQQQGMQNLRAARGEALTKARDAGAIDVATFDRLFQKPTIDVADVTAIETLLKAQRPTGLKALFNRKVTTGAELQSALNRELAAGSVLNAAEHALKLDAIHPETFEDLARITQGQPLEMEVLATVRRVREALIKSEGPITGPAAVEHNQKLAALVALEGALADSGLMAIGLVPSPTAVGLDKGLGNNTKTTLFLAAGAFTGASLGFLGLGAVLLGNPIAILLNELGDPRPDIVRAVVLLSASGMALSAGYHAVLGAFVKPIVVEP